MRQTVRMVVERDLAVSMRDGTILYADCYRPAEEGRYPVLLQRTPYDKEITTLALMQTDTFRAVRRGYAVVIQDVRGRYRSEGTFNPFHQEIPDGYDTVEWCAAQPWADGNVGMFGTSYVGAVQWLAAISRPPSLKAIIPTFTASDYYEGWTYQGGALQWGFLCNWVFPFLATADLYRRQELEPATDYAVVRDSLITDNDNMASTVNTLPIGDVRISPELSGYFREWLAHPSRDEFWQAVSIQDRHATVDVPALNVGGWYDIFLDGTLRNFAGVRSSGATEAARSGTKLILGPWTHTTPPTQASGQIDFGTQAGQGANPLAFNIDTEHLRFFDYWLKGVDDGVSREAPVKLFVMGEGVWRDEREWPLARAISVDYFLHSGGDANSATGDGVLSIDPPTLERPDSYLYDPFHPVPSNGGQTCCNPVYLPPGPYDQRPVESRTDVLIYKTAPLEDAVEVTGPVSLTLWASTTAVDTDFTGKLVDIHPDGRTINLTDGIIRAKYRAGTDQPRPIAPGEAVEYTIDLWSTSNLFKPGHRIGLEVSSSNFPRFDRNLNTGDQFGAEMKPALQTVLHDAEHPSRLTLPIIPRKAK
jgi:putative CocE/NonD family hydrolase